MVKVVAYKGEDKEKLFDQVVEESGLLSEVQTAFTKSGKKREDFLIAIKPNIMMFTHKEDPITTYTDPSLVERLVELLKRNKFTRIAVVDAQNMYGNWYKNRTVENVAKLAGYRPKEHGYTIVDLTLEKAPHNFGGTLGEHYVGKTWRDADFRISFAKNKTHTENFYTLTLKNIYGVLPLQDKGLEYHGKREWDKSALDMLRNFPLHFGLIDAFHSADGLLGFKGTTSPKKTQMFFASPSLIAVDMVAARMMGLDPEVSSLTRLAISEWGRPKIELVSNVEEDYVHKGWQNVVRIGKISVPDILNWNPLYRLIIEVEPHLYDHLGDLVEEDYLSFSILGIITNGLVGDQMNPKAFPLKTPEELAPYIIQGALKNLRHLIFDQTRQMGIVKNLQDFLRGFISLLSRRNLTTEIEDEIRKLGQKLNVEL